MLALRLLQLMLLLSYFAASALTDTECNGKRVHVLYKIIMLLTSQYFCFCSVQESHG